MNRWMLVVAALSVWGCKKGGDSGKVQDVPPDCAEFTAALADCYAAGGFELSDGGIDPEAWCLDETEAGVSADVYACRITVIEAGECSTSAGIASVSEQLSICLES